MRFGFGGKGGEQARAKPTPPYPDLDRVLDAAESLSAAEDDDIQRNYNKVKENWGAKDLLALSAADLRRRVTKILANDAAAGFDRLMVDPHESAIFPYLQFNTISDRSRTGRFYRIAKRQDGRYALYGHEAMYR